MDPQYEPATIAGVITLTAFIVSQLKTFLGTAPYIRRIPVIFVAIAVSLVICVLAKFAGMLEGHIGKLMAQSAIAALGSSGLYSIYSGSSTKSMNEAQTGLPPVAKPSNDALWAVCLASSVALVLLCSGCGAIKSYQDSTPLGKVALAKTDFTKALNMLADLRDQGFVTQAQLDKVKPSVLAAQLALQEWETLAANNQDTKDVEARFEAAADVIRRLRDALQPATKPSAIRSTPHEPRPITYVDRRWGFTCRYASA